MRRALSLITLVVLLMSSLAPLAAPSFAGPTGAPIRLKTDTFRPGLGEQPEIPPGLAISEAPAGQAGYYLVQFNGPIQPAWKAQLAELGAGVVEYIPEFAFKVRMTPATAARVRGMEAVTWLDFFHPAYKISPQLGAEELLRVELTEAADLDEITAALAALGGYLQKVTGRSLTVQLPPAQVPALAHLQEVAWIQAEPEFELHNNIARAGNGGMDAYPLWNLGIFGEGQIAAVADTGLDTNNTSTVHLDFRGRVVQIDVLGDLSTDTDGHGTHTSGSIVGNGTESGTNPASHDYGQNDSVDPNQTTTKVTGIAPEAQLYFQAIACYSPFFGLTLCGLPNDLNQLFQPPYDAGARVHSNSWGADVAGDYDGSSQDVDQFMWNNPDMLVTTSAGNAGIDADNDGWVDQDSIGSPATAKNVLTVGATENARTNGGVNYESTGNDLDELQCSGNGGGPAWRNCWPDDFDAAPTGPDLIGGTGNAGEMAAFSSRGPTDDGRIKPDVVAAGTNILSTMSSQASSCGWGNGELNDKYCMNGGTSMSNPLTAGAATLVRDWYQDVKGQANPSAALIKATLINTAVDIAGYGDTSQEAGQPIPNNHEGWGRVNLANVATDGRAFYDGDSLNTGGTATYNLNAPGGAPFKVSLVWSDYPASTSASTTLVNDLDLVVSGPGGTFYGNVFSGGWSQTGGSADRTNNVENVYIQSAGAGTWTVEVQGYNVPYGPQPFALVVDGGASGPVDTPPSVSITDPVEDQTLAGTYRVLVSASDDSALSAVELSIDGGAYADITADFDGNHYYYDWDTTAYADGAHTLQARATDDAAQSTDSTVVNVTVDNVNDPPVATFTYSCSGLSCDFDGSGSYDADGSIVNYAWDFGDGNNGGGQTASHTYASAGTYPVVLTVTDDDGATGTDSQNVTAAEAAAAHIGDLDGSSAVVRNKWDATVTVTVHDAQHGPVGDATVSGTWLNGASGSGACTTSAGGQCTITLAGIHVKVESVDFRVDSLDHSTYTYDAPANHDPDGDSDGTTITVFQTGSTNQPPVATFTYSCTDLSCDFDASGSYDPDGSIVSYAWDFGDGNIGGGQTASHTYASAGTYPVVLTVTDDGGAAGTDSQNVTAGGSGGGTFYVSDIAMTGKAAGPNRSASAVVTILDTDGNPVAGATVYGTWSGDYNGTVSGVTGADGTVSFDSGKVRQADATFTFTVDDVVLSGYVYDPALNAETSDTITVP
ncbi:MAG: PKD domain-containing protein [Anaerolineae bacterium]